MTMKTLTLTDFLLARIAEDEAAAQACTNQSWAWADTSGRKTIADMEHVDRHSPARVLAEGEAKRWIVARLQMSQMYPRQISDHAAHSILRALALPYADHPDYDPGWRP